MVQSMFLPGPEPGEQRKEDGFGSRLQQSNGLPYGGELQSRCRLQTRGVHFQEGEGERERDNSLLEKGGCAPPYIGQGGVLSSSPPPCGTKLPRGGVRRPRGGVGPTLHAKPKGGTPSSP